MARNTKKDKVDEVISEEKETKKKASKTTTKSKSSSKTTAKKVDEKKGSSADNKTTTKKTTTKKSTKKKTSINPFKSILSRRSRKPKAPVKDEINLEDDLDSTIEKSTILEYYDLPYRYNQTTVKILAQTPSILFVYWDISDEDRAKLSNKYGDGFFNDTKPVLLIHNKTKNYSFEVDINDFANSWYLRMQEPNCEYSIELGRRNIQNKSEYIYLTSSNDLISPNDHVLFEKTDFTKVKFKNVNDGHIETKDFGSLRLLSNIGKIYNKDHKVFAFYNNFYKDEVLENKTMFSNPSSGNPTSGNFRKQ